MTASSTRTDRTPRPASTPMATLALALCGLMSGAPAALAQTEWQALALVDGTAISTDQDDGLDFDAGGLGAWSASVGGP